jgi:2-hydroxychromene-2-carboxylate isomerase
MPRRVDVYLSVVSPWAHLGNQPFLDLARRHGVTVTWKPVPLLEVFAETGGAPLAKRAPARQRYRFVELKRWAERRARPLILRPKHWPFNPSLADRAAIALGALGLDPAPYVVAACRGVWEEELDLADRDTVAEILTAQGFDASAALAVADAPEAAAVYEANRAEAIAADVFGSPSYVLEGEVFWGQDRLDLLDEALASGRGPYGAA